jgi:hypothetical protein
MLIGRQLDAFLRQPAQTRRRLFNDLESVGWEQRLASGHSDDRIDVFFHSKVSEHSWKPERQQSRIKSYSVAGGSHADDPTT